MSVYESKLYPVIPSAPDDAPMDQVYRLQNIREIYRFLNSEIIDRQRLYKKFHRCELVACYLEHTLIAAGVVTAGGSIAVLTTGVGIPVSIVLVGLAIGASIATSITKQTSREYNTKAKKNIDLCISQTFSL